MKTFETSGKATIEVFFNAPIPKEIKVFHNGDLYFLRNFKTPQQRIKFNIAHAGKFAINCNCEDLKVLPIVIHPLDVQLPTPDRNLVKPFKVVLNPTLVGTPARNFTKKGIIEVSPKFKTYPFCIRMFILYHERGHFLYRDEELADTWAAKNFIADGYNNSSAYYALRNVLNFDSQKNKDRLKHLFKNLHR